jgi:hypothetical protein
MRTKFMNQWVVLDFDGSIRRAQIIDIVFHDGLGPQFLLQSSLGNKFWLSRKELKDHELIR